MTETNMAATTALKGPPKLAFFNFSSGGARPTTRMRQLIRSMATAHSHRDPSRKPKSKKGMGSKTTSDSNIGSPVRPDQSTSSDEVVAIPLCETFLPLADQACLAQIIQNWDPNRDIALAARLHDEPPPREYPVPSQSWYAEVRKYYRDEYQSRGLSLMKPSPDTLTTYVEFENSRALVEPALFYKQLFLACASLQAQGKMSRSTLFWLKGKCYEALNEALRDTERSRTPEVMLVVASFAHWECLYGENLAVSMVHIKAFRHLLSLYDGLENVELPYLGFRLLKMFHDQMELRAEKREPDAGTPLVLGWEAERRNVPLDAG